MKNAITRAAVALASNPNAVKNCALYAFRLVRRLGHEAEQTPDRVRWAVKDVTDAWVESGWHRAKTLRRAPRRPSPRRPRVQAGPGGRERSADGGATWA